uniref:Uncharacterized protein n=1 Tax=Rhizophora mucronata TaxID=61149 RepID=A0A2P2JM97_RHIMU
MFIHKMKAFNVVKLVQEGRKFTSTSFSGENDLVWGMS